MQLTLPGPVDRQPLAQTDAPIPVPGAGDIRIRVRACGVCHTDLHIVEGDIAPARLPIVPGHQVVGTVDGRGSRAERFREGDRVGVPWLYSTCGECAYCHSGRENLCEQARFTGYHIDGGYAVVSAVIGVSSSAVGIYVSYYGDLSAGASIVLTCTVLFLLALVFSPRDGMLARLRPERRSG